MVYKVFYVLWKDLLLRRNHYIATTVEVLLPISLIIIANLVVPKETEITETDSIVFEDVSDKQCISKHSHYGSIVYEPSTPFIDTLMSKAGCYAGYKKSNVLSGHLNDSNSYFSIGVKFENISENDNTIPNSITYALFPTSKVFLNMKSLWKNSNDGALRYSIPSLHSIVELQRGIDTSFLDLKNISIPKITLEDTNVPNQNSEVFILLIYLVLFLAFTLMIPPIISRVVQEKFTGAKELMLMMGVSRWQLWVAKFIEVFIFMSITVAGMVIFLFIPLKSSSNYLKISPYLFWGFIMYGLISVILFLFFMSCFFQKPTLAMFITQLVWIFSFVAHNILSKFVVFHVFVKYLVCLFPHICLMQGVSILLKYDSLDKKIKLNEKLSNRADTLTLLNVLIMMTVNIFIYVILTWYLEQVKPGKFGVPQTYWFCFKKNYWFPREILGVRNNIENKSKDGFEQVPAGLRVGVSIQNVSKVYKSLNKGSVIAVDDVSMNFYHSEISGVLGHNGAGKTTLFSMITGLTCPTSGKIIINGYDLSVNVSEARKSLGLCPQHDMLFDDLTTIQILKFYGVVKGLRLKEAKREAFDLIKKLKLTSVKNTRAGKLSGGQRRKVSLAIAVIGGSQVLILDEPTAGMDPEIRREIWEILLGYRGERTILLTTHFMEEADALCDRIAIVDHGKVKCYGSPMFLKSKFGKGYILNVVVRDIDSANNLVDYVKESVPGAKLKSQNVRTLVFVLPENQVSVFPDLLSGLEKKTKNEITSYSVNLCTLEDVFLRLRSGHEEPDEFDMVDSTLTARNISYKNTLKTSWCRLYFTQFWALIIKKLILFRRSYISFLLYTILPAALVILVTYLSERGTEATMKAHVNEDGNSLSYSLCLYPSSLVLYSHLNDTHGKELLSDLVRGCGSEIQEVNDIRNAVREIYERDFYTYAKKVILGIDFSKENLKIYHNENAVHMVPISLNFIHSFLLKYFRRNDSIETTISVRHTGREPLGYRGIIVSCTVSAIPDYSGIQTIFYLMGPLKERFFGSKDLQLMVTPAFLYWLSHYIIDILTFIPFIFVIFVGVGLVDGDVFQFFQTFPDLTVLGFLLWGSGLILICYVISTFVKNSAAAFTVYITVYTLLGFLLYYIIDLDGIPKYYEYLHPTCILKLGLNEACIGKKDNFVWALLGYNICLFLFLLLKDSMLLDRIIHRFCSRISPIKYSQQEGKDEFVREEEETVEKEMKNGKILSYALLVSELKRWYCKGFRRFPAVRGISFSVNRGECFGLLGVNGAGKTSTFKILTGGLTASQGKTYACSEKLTFCGRRKYLFSIGYCPQFGGLIPVLKATELLTFFARLRGIPKPRIEQEVHKWLDKMNLIEYANRKCGTYSGGNQRKLSTAIALIGDRPLIFLDEPTTGVDPLSRRSIWSVIGDIQREGQSIVLTSHSMDECEALCSRLAIMVNGRFRCIGEITTLKDRFGQGFYVQLKVSSVADPARVKSLKDAVVSAFGPGCNLVDEHLTVLQYHVTNKNITWPTLFSQLNVLKKNYNVLETFSASSTTLEQIFIYFARNPDETV